jgi:hypothetical protein
MFDVQAADELLIEATTKLLWLRQQDDWAKELPSRCPPILWFGNARSSKPKVLTIGANPSRWEYLDESCRENLAKVKASGDESLLRYLEPPKNRFRVLGASSESLEQVVKDRGLRDKIIQGYNDYFLECRNPYQKWFGKKDGYRVEGFLRGLGASFYDAQEMQYQAIHFDLLPFATLSDFKNLEETAADDLFTSEWAKRTVAKLVCLLQPETVIAFGRTNVDCFAEHIDTSVHCLSWIPHGAASYQIGKAEELKIAFVGLSVNLGNPRGFDSAGLRAFGSHVGSLMRQRGFV